MSRRVWVDWSQRCCGIQSADERTTGSQRMVGRSSYGLRLCLTYGKKVATRDRPPAHGRGRKVALCALISTTATRFVS